MTDIIKQMCDRKLVCSMAEARRLIAQKAVKVNEEVITENKEVPEDCTIKIGKKICSNL